MSLAQKSLRTFGPPLTAGARVVIALHGRGGNAADMLLLSQSLQLSLCPVLAPQAQGNSWYPFSFMAARDSNEPCLSQSLRLIAGMVAEIEQRSIPAEHIFFLGFSQGACLACEFVARNPRRYGGLISLTGGLIGHSLDEASYSGGLAETPILMTSGDPDPHVPRARVEQSARIFERMGACVQAHIFSAKPHIISEKELQLARHFFRERLEGHGIVRESI